MSPDWEGLLLIDKPAGPTSHDVVAQIRRLTRTRRIGHAGTLDPPASGLLPLVLGRATRLVRFLPQSPKVYGGAIELGRTTTTDDDTGETLTRHAGPPPADEQVQAASRQFVGSSMQVPPRVAARKVDGQRMYALARRGEEFERRPSAVEIFRFDLRPGPLPGQWVFEIEVSSGTYVRAIARDLGQLLGCGGCLSGLRRLRIGPLDVAAAVPLSDATPETLAAARIPLDRLPIVPPDAAVGDAAAALRFSSGQAVPAVGPTLGGPVAVRDDAGALLGVGELLDGWLHPRVVLAAR